MAERVSRRKIAQHVARELLAGRGQGAIRQLAALIVAEHRQRETSLMVRDIEDALAEHGVVVADVTTAHGLTAELEQAVQRIVGSEHVIIRAATDPSVIGGLAITVPGKRYNGTVQHKLSELRAQKV